MESKRREGRRGGKKEDEQSVKVDEGNILDKKRM